MNRDEKAALVEELAEQIRLADAIFAVDYRGISVGDAAELRGRLRDAGTRFRIVKNSLTERASDAAGQELLKPMLEGPTALAFVAGDAALAAKALNDMARALGTLEFKGGVMNGAALSAEDVRSIARLPAREVLHGQLVGTIAAPLSGLVRRLNALIAGLAIQLRQIADQGLASGEGSSASGDAPSSASGDAPADASSDAEPDAEAASEPEAAEAEPKTEAEGEPASEPEAASASEANAPEAEADHPETEARPASQGGASEDESKED